MDLERDIEEKLINRLTQGVSQWTRRDDIKTVSQLWDNPSAAIDQFVAFFQGKLQGMLSTAMEFGNKIANALSFNFGSGSGGGQDVSHNADGGIYRKGAFLTTFAEEGPEAAIPLDGSRRAVSLWQQAGHLSFQVP